MTSAGPYRWGMIAVALCSALALLPGCPIDGVFDTPAGLPGEGGSPDDGVPQGGGASTDTAPPDGGSSPPSGGGSSGSGTANPDVSDPCLQVGRPASAVHLEMLDALNRYRTSKGLEALSYSRILEKAADGHAIDMYRRSFFDHTNPEGDGPLERALDAGFCRAWVVGENIAWNQQSVAEVQTAWQNSPGHDANMVNPHFRYVGMGYYPSANGPYYVQVFGDAFPRD